jgi:hypothetical protein
MADLGKEMRGTKISVHRIFSQHRLQERSDCVNDLCLPGTILTAETRYYGTYDVGIQCCHGAISSFESEFLVVPLGSIHAEAVVGLRDRTLSQPLIYSSRASPPVHMNLDDHYLSIGAKPRLALGVSRTLRTVDRNCPRLQCRRSDYFEAWGKRFGQ